MVHGTMASKKELKEGQEGGKETAEGAARWADVKEDMVVGWAGVEAGTRALNGQGKWEGRSLGDWLRMLQGR